MRIIALLLSLLFAFPASAALDFAGTSDKIVGTTAPFTAAPFSVCGWVRNDDAADSGAMASVSTNGSGSHWMYVGLMGSVGGDPFRFSVRTTAETAADFGTFSAGTLYHVCAVASASNARELFINGSSVGTNTTDRVLAGMNEMRIGARIDSTPAETTFLDGLVAELGFWNRALGAAEITGLAAGFAPNCYPAGLTNYTPLIRTVQDLKTATGYTTTGTTVVAHVRVLQC